MALHWIANYPGTIDDLRLVEYPVPAPGRGEVTVRVIAAGVNPADYKHIANGSPADYPMTVGYEVAGVVTAVGADTEIASGKVAVGDDVLAFRITGGWATEVTVPAKDVFAKPPSIPYEEAANLLLAGTTAAEMLHVTGVDAGDTILVHGASGAVGVSVLQQAAILGATVIGTANALRFEAVRQFGGIAVAYGDGLEDRVRAAAPDGIAAVLDCAGTDEAIDVSLALVPSRSRIVTIAAKQRAAREGLQAIGGAMPASKAYRDAARADIIRLTAEGRLDVPMASTYPLDRALEAVRRVQSGHPGGKLALMPPV